MSWLFFQPLGERGSVAAFSPFAAPVFSNQLFDIFKLIPVFTQKFLTTVNAQHSVMFTCIIRNTLSITGGIFTKWSAFGLHEIFWKSARNLLKIYKKSFENLQEIFWFFCKKSVENINSSLFSAPWGISILPHCHCLLGHHWVHLFSCSVKKERFV